MLQIIPLSKENMLQYNTVDRRYLSGELAMVKINRTGFGLTYTPMAEAKWRQDSPSHYLPAEEMIRRKDMVCYLAFTQGKCVGQITLVENWNRRGMIWEMAVDLQHRRKGIGTELLRACEDWAKSKKLYGLMTEVSDGNPAACQFFNKTGFVLGGVDQMLYHSLPSEQKKAPQLRDTALSFYNDFE